MSHASAPERYFVKLYGSQHRIINRAYLSHTFAVFTERMTQADGSVLNRDLTISWLPRNGRINPLGLAEAGHNFTLAETFAWLDEADSKVRWESQETEIQKILFTAADERVRELEAGDLRYKMIDRMRTRPNEISNCIHAVCDLREAIDKLGMAFTGALHGIEASRFVYHYFRSFYHEHPAVSDEDEEVFDAVHHASLRAQMEAPPTRSPCEQGP
jgi:hypothetical protein